MIKLVHAAQKWVITSQYNNKYLADIVKYFTPKYNTFPYGVIENDISFNSPYLSWSPSEHLNTPPNATSSPNNTEKIGILGATGYNKLLQTHDFLCKVCDL